MAEGLFETNEDPLETAIKIALLEDEVESTKKNLKDADTALERAEDARLYCLEQAERYAAEDRAKIDLQSLEYTSKIEGLTAEIDTLKKKVKILEATNAEYQERDKSFRYVAINALPRSPASTTRSAASSHTRSDQGQLCLFVKLLLSNHNAIVSISVLSRRTELGTFYRLDAAQLDPDVFRIIDALQNENKYLQQRNEILHQRNEAYEKRVEVLEEVVTDLVHDGKHPEEQQRSQKMREMREQLNTLETELDAAKSMAGRYSLEMLEKNEALRQNLVEENEALKQKVKELAA